MRIYEFKVKGKVGFPIDMLRHDACYPATAEDSNAIESSIVPYHRERPLPVHEVNLVCITSRMAWTPTEGRWNSFLWTVVEGSVKEV